MNGGERWMTTDDLNSGEVRMINTKIKYNQKQLDKAEKAGDDELIKKYTYNIKQYEKELRELK